MRERERAQGRGQPAGVGRVPALAGPSEEGVSAGCGTQFLNKSGFSVSLPASLRFAPRDVNSVLRLELAVALPGRGAARGWEHPAASPGDLRDVGEDFWDGIDRVCGFPQLVRGHLVIEKRIGAGLGVPGKAAG